MRLRRVICLASGLFVSLCLTLSAQEKEDAVADAAETPLFAFVESNIATTAATTIAVMPFCHEDGSQSMEGKLIAERLLTRMSENPLIRVVEREHLDQALKEQKLGAEGFLSPETAARTGKLTGASRILAGTITEMGSVVEIHARLFSVESGDVLAAVKVKARRAIKTFISPLWDDIDRIKATGRKFKAELSVNDEHIRIGDQAVLKFEVDRDCYVTVLDFSTDGSITVLFPNRFQSDNHVKANRAYELPSEAAGYKIRVRGPAGIERLKLFATGKDVQLYVRDYSQSPFSAVEDGDQDFVRGLQATLDSLETTDWAEASCEFQIENVFRSGK